MYLPLHNVARKKYLVRVPVRIFCFFTVSFPLVAIIVCVLLTMYKDFDSANHTHCKVINIIPSISATIGNYEPQNTIWKSAIYIHSPLRFFIIYLRWNFYSNEIRKDCAILVQIAVLLNILENINLLGLTYWTSSLNYPYHKFCFELFIATSILYMLLTCIMLKKYRERPIFTHLETFSIKLKQRAFIINAGSFACAVYFFIRHNKLCEPYAYSMFGFSEYIVVLSNIVFHMSTAYDIPRKFIYLTTKGIAIE